MGPRLPAMTADSAAPGAARSALAPRPFWIELLLVSRPAGWLASVGLFRCGMAYGDAPETARSAALTACLSAPFCLFLFGLNDAADHRSDRDNPRKGNLLHGARLDTVGAARVKRAALAAGAAMLLWALFLPAAAATLLLGVLALSWAYSMPPLRLKEVPLLDGLSSAGIISGLLALGFVQGASLAQAPVEPWVFAPSIVGLHIFASVMDVESDRRAGHRTLPVRVGPRWATAVALALSLLTAAAVPLVDFAPPIAAFAVAQAVIIAGSLALPALLSPRRAFLALAVAAGGAMAYLLFVYL